MPVFEYVAVRSDGKSRRGTVESESVRSARQKLRSQGIFATEIKEGKESQTAGTKDVAKFLRGDRVSLPTLASATRQLATLVGASIPLVESLQALADQLDSAVLRRVVIDVKERVESGSSLARGLAAYPKTFPRLYINMVGSGEASGTLDTVLENLADYLEGQVALRRKISAALFYPALMLVFCLLVIAALLTFVVPTIVDIFTKQGAVLPFPTRVMIGVSDAVRGYWLLGVAAVLAAAYGYRTYYRTAAGRDRIDRALLRAPVLGTLYRKVITARVARTLGTLMSSGVGLLESLDIVKNIVGNIHVVRAVEEARDGVREGRSLGKEMARSGIFPQLLSQMISVGERSGRLEPMLGKAGQAYENEVDAAVAGLTSLIEPLMIIGLGGIVVSIVVSILLPMLDLMDVVQR